MLQRTRRKRLQAQRDIEEFQNRTIRRLKVEEIVKKEFETLCKDRYEDVYWEMIFPVFREGLKLLTLKNCSIVCIRSQRQQLSSISILAGRYRVKVDFEWISDDAVSLVIQYQD
ncbi:hypothetical protein A2602_02605 [candidate division WWE3 bacterium RIFOXYD1_FULL_40_11]|nr:MAG: hypothetical protein A2602_02605 [candidate division WWE3 bacterium RIFOXYD1_FULL_40_11]